MNRMVDCEIVPQIYFSCDFPRSSVISRRLTEVTTYHIGVTCDIADPKPV